MKITTPTLHVALLPTPNKRRKDPYFIMGTTKVNIRELALHHYTTESKLINSINTVEDLKDFVHNHH